jgi:pilus assembly protein CpaB
MNQNESRTFWISVAAALCAVFLLYSYTQEKSAELTKKFGAKQRVVVAARDINEMETIDETMLQIVERPVDFVEPQATSDLEAVVGQVALAPIKKEEQILQSKIIKPGPVTGLSLQVAPSKRAVSIPIDETRGVSKLLNPGDRVDIITALDVGKGVSQRREVKTLMQDVVVLATGLRVVNELPVLYEKMGKADFLKNLRGDTSFNTITIEASPEEAQDLIYILSTSPGSLFLTLRHPSDHQKRRLPESSIESLLGQVTKAVLSQQQRVPAAAPAPAPAPVVKPKPKKKGPFVDM